MGFSISAFRKCICVLFLAAAVPAAQAAVSDMDNDGRSDILWRNATNGMNYLFPMNGRQVLGGQGYLPTIADQNWQIAGVGDFDGNGTADILYRNAATGFNYIYFMNGRQVTAEGYMVTVADQDWQVAGIADFDGDGKADVFFRNQASGFNYIYSMNGRLVQSEGYIPTVDTQWQVAGVGDFDGDNKADIFWRNPVTGFNYVFPMDGRTVKSTQGYFPTVDVAWQVAGIGDFNNDGRADTLWRNRLSGFNYIYFMDGRTSTGGGYITTVADTDWRVAAIGNYDGLAGDDILWRHVATDNNYMHLLNGTSITGEGYVESVARAWRPLGGELAPQAGGTPGCASTGPAGGITPSIAAARTSGVAPLAVFFDASGTTGGINPFHNLEYRWSFSDATSGAWKNGARPGASSRNSAAGPMAAHVFELPGTYRVCMTAFDGITRAAQAVTITVQDPDAVFAGNTTCFSNDTDFTGCPDTAAKATTSSFVTVVAAAGGTARRLLMRRGHTFAAGATNTVLSASGPGILGAFGPPSSPRPRVTATAPGSSGGVLELSRSSTPGFSDWRVVDIEIDATGFTNIGAHAISAEGGASQITMLRLSLHDMSIGINFNYQTALDGNNMGANNGHQNWDQIAIVDCDIRDMYDNAGIYLTSQRFALLGTAVEDVNPSTSGHTTRFPSLNKAIISNSTLSHPTLGLQTIKLHSAPWPIVTGSVSGSALTVNVNADAYYGVAVSGPGIPANTFVDGGSGSTISLTRAATAPASGTYTLRGALPDYTEQVVISDNRIIGSVDQTRAVNIMPQSASNRDERLRNILVERNWFITGSGNSHALAVDADNVTIRNNICDGSASSDPICVSVMQERPSSLGSGANDVRVYNNTGFSSRSGGSFYMTELEDTVTNITVRNNLAYTPSVSDRRMVNGTGASGLVTSNNSVNMQTNPNFVGPTSSPAGFRPGAGSYAIGASIAVPGVWSDFFLMPQPALRDLGAVLH